MLATTVPRRLTDGRTISVCTFSLPRDKYLAYYLADLVLFYATPLLTASVLYALIARTLLRSTRPVVHRSRRPTGENEAAMAAKRDRTMSGTDGASTPSDITSNVQVVSSGQTTIGIITLCYRCARSGEAASECIQECIQSLYKNVLYVFWRFDRR